MSAAGQNDWEKGVEVDEDKPILAEQKRAQAAGNQFLKTAGNMPLRLILFIGCIGTAVILIFELGFSNVFQFVQDIWTILFCLSLALVEICWWSCAPRFLLLRLRLKLLRSFNFLTRAWGKGMLVIYIGSIMLAKWELFDIISGVYMLIIGALLIIFGRYSEMKMKRLMGKQISFASVNKNNDDNIDINELQAAAADAGIPMTDCELYLAFALLDTNGDGVVSIEEFEHYFNKVKFEM